MREREREREREKKKKERGRKKKRKKGGNKEGEEVQSVRQKIQIPLFFPKNVSLLSL